MNSYGITDVPYGGYTLLQLQQARYSYKETVKNNKE